MRETPAPAPRRTYRFETSAGWASLGVSAAGLCEVGWPGQAGAGAGRLPGEWASLAARLRRHWAGKPQSYDDVPLDLSHVPPFHRAVYEAARALRPGQVCTYAELAGRLGRPGAVRAVGQALARNPLPLVIPCHRVLAAGGGAGGFSAPGGLLTKAQLLAAEGVLLPVERQPMLDVLAARAHLRRVDPVLGRIIDAVGPCGLRRQVDEGSPFEALGRAVIYQQLNGRAAATIHARVLALCEGRRLSPDALSRVSDEALREAGVSGSKLLALRDLSAHAAAGAVPSWKVLDRVPDALAVSHLSRVRGVGPWTVQMLLLFQAGRPDVLPVEDFAVQKAFSQLYGVEGKAVKAALAAHAERWRPHRSAASWYLWRSLELR